MPDTSNRNLMILGTASGVGKTLVTLAICRWLKLRHIDVAPFKALSVAEYLFETDSGGAMHSHQAHQAIAAGLAPEIDMNPVALSRSADSDLQVVVLGRSSDKIGRVPAERRHVELRSVITAAYHRLAAKHDFIVIEGCGSPVELNLLKRDMVNMWLANAVDATCILVANIENVGAFASIIGTLSLLEPADRARVVGIIINKFHGDPASFKDGVQIIEERTGIPCLGVVPFLPGLKYLGAEPGKLGTAPKTPSKAFLKELDKWSDHVISSLDTELLAKLTN